KEEDLFRLVRRAYPYRELSRADFDAVLEMLSEGIAARRGRYGAYLYRDRVNQRVRGRRGSRLAAITSGGAIPDNAHYSVVALAEAPVRSDDRSDDPESQIQNPKLAPLASAVSWLKQECGLDDSAAEQLMGYIVAGRALLGAVPTQKTVVAERFFDEAGGMQLI